MKTAEKFAVLNAAVTATGMSEKELQLGFQSRQTSSAEPIKSIFPVIYKKGNEFEISPFFLSELKDEVWGFEILPGITLAKKCGADGNIESTTWGNSKSFAEECKLNGESGYLPSKEVLKKNWSEELRDQIQAMDKFLCENGVDAETRWEEDVYYVGIPWCSEVNGNDNAYYFYLDYGSDGWNNKDNVGRYDRLAVAFKKFLTL